MSVEQEPSSWSTQMENMFSLNIQDQNADVKYQSPLTPNYMSLDIYQGHKADIASNRGDANNDNGDDNEIASARGESNGRDTDNGINTNTTTTTNSSTVETNMTTTPATLDDFLMNFDSGATTATGKDKNPLVSDKPLGTHLQMNFVDSSSNGALPFSDQKGRRATIYNGFFESMHLDTMLDDYLSTELLLNEKPNGSNNNNDDDETVANERRHSEVVTGNTINLASARNSISHGVDFWNVDSHRKRGSNNGLHRDGHVNKSITRRATGGTEKHLTDDSLLLDSDISSHKIDNELSQILSDYNMNFKPGTEESPLKYNTADYYNFDGNSEDVSHSCAGQSHRPFMKNPHRASLPILSEATPPEYDLDIKKKQPDVSIFKDIPWESFNAEGADENDLSVANQNFYNPEIISSPKSPNDKFIKPTMILSDASLAEVEMMNNSIKSLNTSLDISIPPDVLNKDLKESWQNSQSRKSISGSSGRRRSSAALSMSNFNNNLHFNINASKSNPRRKSKPSISPNSSLLSSNIDKNNDIDKPFGCHLCSKAFKRSEHLKRHVRSVHSTDRPFSCHLCEKKFSRSDNLSQHIKTHKKSGTTSTTKE